ncbi:MAG: TolB family protein, partial [Polyangia bacterium]
DGSEAWITEGHDTPPRLVVRGPDGRTRLDRLLIDVLPPRRLVVASAEACGSPSFTADGRSVYFTSLDLGPTFQASRLVRVDVATGALDVVLGDLRGGGGSISPDGRAYAFSYAAGDHHDLVLLDVATRQARVLVAEPAGDFVSMPRYSADGARIVAAVFESGRHWIRVFDAATGRTLATLGDGRPVHDASFADASHIVYLAADGPDLGFQVQLGDLATGAVRQLTRAPYLAFEPQMAGDRVRFLNREGWNWTLDEQPVTAPATAPATPPPLPVSPPLPPVEAVAIERDEPYKSTDHLFRPQLQGVAATAVGRNALMGEVVLAGGDRLQFHRWTLNGLLQLNGGQSGYGFGAAYANRQLAPWTIIADARALRYQDTRPAAPALMSPVPLAPAPFVLTKTEVQGNLRVTRDVYGAPVELGFDFTDDQQPGEPTVRVAHRRVAGPFLGAAYEGLEVTPYTGVRRGAAAFPSINLFPAAWNTAGATLTDVRLELVGVTPLPLSRRHTLILDLRGRALAGLPDGQRWLQVGGGVTALARNGATSPLPPEVKIAPLPDLRFDEPLRGYEDYPLATDRTFIAELTYRYPLIVDRGSASTLWILPSSFLRQIDFELFGSAASDARAGGGHAAGGAAVVLQLAMWRLPFSLGYQVARRGTDDHALAQIISFNVD